MIPALYIRLGRDQAAYDFMKWYATTGQDPRYNWGDIDLPFLDIKDGDVLESPAGMWTDEWLDLSHCSAVVLVKVRVPSPARYTGCSERSLRTRWQRATGGHSSSACRYHRRVPSIFNNPAASIAVKPVAYSPGGLLDA